MACLRLNPLFSSRRSRGTRLLIRQNCNLSFSRVIATGAAPDFEQWQSLRQQPRRLPDCIFSPASLSRLQSAVKWKQRTEVTCVAVPILGAFGELFSTPSYDDSVGIFAPLWLIQGLVQALPATLVLASPCLAAHYWYYSDFLKQAQLQMNDLAKTALKKWSSGDRNCAFGYLGDLETALNEAGVRRSNVETLLQELRRAFYT